MNGWNEDNFLERLMPQLRQKRGAERGPCPDAETLCGVLEGTVRGPLRQLVTEHVKHCQECADLQNRVLNFDTGAPPESEAVWNQTRARLDNWLEGFLRSEAASSRPAKLGEPSRRVLRWQTFWSPLISWKVAWGLGLVALLVLIADGVLLMELRRGQPPQVPVAARPAVPQKQQANAEPPGKPVEKSPSQRRIEKPLEGPPEHGLPQVAQHLPAQPEVPHGQRAGPSRGQVAAPLPSSPPLNAAAAPAAGPPPALRLEPGAHLLIVLSSIERLPNGRFQFRGILLLPVAQSGSVPLNRGAEVIGAGTMSQGQTSLAVTELVVQGASYTLKGGDGAMKAQSPGAGGAVQFDRSQALEMWPASTSIYEKAPDRTEQPEPQK
ncbi:MAG: hypothetical protein LAO04_18910 [Acidobacteriia bacterium]|nr:hypothetical protein [Terriglobia bacterium]